MDFHDCTHWISDLDLQTEPVTHSIIGLGILPLHDVRIERMELVVFHHLVACWLGDLLWLQQEKKQA